MGVEDKLFFVKARPDVESHIKVNEYFCGLCKGKECTKFCPSNVFSFSEIDGRFIVAYENCLECGACTIGCPYGAIQYENPKEKCGLV